MTPNQDKFEKAGKLFKRDGRTLRTAKAIAALPVFILCFSFSPIIRFPVELRNGYDNYLRASGLINQPIREAIQNTPTSVPRKRRPSEWVLANVSIAA